MENFSYQNQIFFINFTIDTFFFVDTDNTPACNFFANSR